MILKTWFDEFLAKLYFSLAVLKSFSVSAVNTSSPKLWSDSWCLSISFQSLIILLSSIFNVEGVNKSSVPQSPKKHMTVEEVKKEVWRYTFVYYNTVRITTVTEDGFPPSVYQGKASDPKAVA